MSGLIPCMVQTLRLINYRWASNFSLLTLKGNNNEKSVVVVIIEEISLSMNEYFFLVAVVNKIHFDFLYSNMSDNSQYINLTQEELDCS